MQLLFKQRDVGRENDKCVRLKLAKTTCLAPHFVGCKIGPEISSHLG